MERRSSAAARVDVDELTADLPLDRAWMERALLERLLPGYADAPVRTLLLASDRLGVGPLTLFDPAWYRTRYSVPPDQLAFLHYLQMGAARGHDPHPLFRVRHYLRSAPEAAGDALRHFLQVGGPQGLDCHPLFASDWYLEANRDVRAAGPIPIVHYLEWGAAEGRDPNPLFSVAHYLEQTDDQGARRNPLLHFVLEGESKGLSPHPSFRAAQVRRTFKAARRPARTGAGPMAAYLGAIGPEQPARVIRLGDPQPDPPILPPPLPRRPRDPAAEASALLAALGMKPEGNGDYCLGKLEAIGRVPAQAADFAASLAQAQGGLPRLITAAGLVPSSEPEAVTDHGDANLGARYAARQSALARRFRLDPARAGTVPAGPKISILLPVYRTPIHLLERAVLSVRCQTYRNWELCIVDDGSKQPGLAVALTRLASREKRIKLERGERNEGIAAATNRALALATGQHVGLLDHDDMLASDALEHVACALGERPGADWLYTDECTIDLDDVPVQLFPKPDWSPALLTGFMYTGHFSVYRTALLRELGGLRSAFDFSQDYDLALRVAETEPDVVHLREVLYGWRETAGSASIGGKPGARLSNIAALQDAMDRRGWAGEAVALPTTNRIVRRRPEPQPLVSIVVPSDHPAHILATVMSIVAHTTYKRYELIVVARDAVIATCGEALVAGCVRFVPFNAAFNFSAKCNTGAKAASGDVLVFLNDDVRVLTPDWLGIMLDALALPGVGAVGPKLLYGDNTIQHAGMVTGTRRLVGTAFHSFPRATSAHFNLAQSLREVSLLSGACLAVPSPLFARLGGFDAANTPIAHSDVDFCLRLREAGHHCLYTPHAELTHLGHQAIGAAERKAGFRRDKADIFLLERWGACLEEDPYWPPAMRELLAWGDARPFRYHAAPRRRGAGFRGDVLLVSHDLSASGAPKIVWDMARVLVAAGRYVLVVAAEDGPFRDRLLQLGADVMIEPDVLDAGPAVIEMARNFDLVIANTVLSWRLLPKLSRLTRAFLYAHETGLAERIASEEPGFAPALAGATGLWAGSERAAAALRPLGLDPLVLEYGVEPPQTPPVEVRGREIGIVTMATMEPRKGQDLAVKAFPLLPKAMREHCQLRLFGRPHDVAFTEAIRALATAERRIQIGPELDLEGYAQALAAADIVLCPSRDDTLPVVSLDALAAGKILVVSKDVGTSAYIEDGVSGFVLRRNHPQDIAATLARIVSQRARWPEIGEAGQRVFRAHFSAARFAERLLGLVGEPLRLQAAAD